MTKLVITFPEGGYLKHTYPGCSMIELIKTFSVWEKHQEKYLDKIFELYFEWKKNKEIYSVSPLYTSRRARRERDKNNEKRIREER